MRVTESFTLDGRGYDDGSGHENQDLDARRLASSAAPSWYVLLRSKDLGRRPIGLSGPGENLVVWRGRTGRAIAMERYCPHHGADLAMGCVDSGQLRCPFHGWRFNEAGSCVAVPGETKIPRSAHRRLRHVTERYGLVWVWSGTDSPLFPLPNIPELDGAAPGPASPYFVRRFRRNIPNLPISRMAENAVDTVHLSEAHGLSLKAIDCTVLEEPCWEVGDPRRPAHADVGAWFGGILEFELQQHDVVQWISNILGVPFGKIRFVIDKWPSGTILRIYSDGRHRNTLVTTASLHGSQGSGAFHGIIITPRHGERRDLASHLIMSIKCPRELLTDLLIWQKMDCSYGGVLVKSDAPIIAYRRWYSGWVKATRAQSKAAVAKSNSDKPRPVDR